MAILSAINFIAGIIFVIISANSDEFKAQSFLTSACVCLCTGFILLGISFVTEAIIKAIKEKPMSNYRPGDMVETKSLLKEISKKISDLLNLKETPSKTSNLVEETRLSEIANCSSKTSSSAAEVVENKMEEQKSESEKNFDNCETVNRNGRTFVQLDGNLYCPKCHSFVDSDLKTMCSNCGKSFME